MDDAPPAQPFLGLHRHRHHPSFHITLPGLQGHQVGLPSSQPALEPPEQYGGRGEESPNSFLTTSASSGGRRASGGGGGGGGLDADTNLGGHLDGASGLESHFSDTWYGGVKKEEVWEDGESYGSITEDFYRKEDCYGNANDVFYPVNCEEVRKVRANYNDYAQGEAVYNGEANVSHFAKQTTSYDYLGREEDYGSSCGSGEDQLQPWLSGSPSSQTGEGRSTENTIVLTSGCLPQRSPLGVSSRAYTQKLDSFSEAFLSQRKRRFALIPGGDSSGQSWDLGVGRDSYLPPSSSPAHPSLPSFPSPPASSHIMSSVLSPPPTPLPPPSHSPSKMDSPGAFGPTGHSASQGGESLGALQFFASHLQSLPSLHSSGTIWKFPLLSHGFSQLAGDPNVDLRPSHADNITASHVHPPETPFLSSHSPSLHPSVNPPSRPCHPPRQRGPTEKMAPHIVGQTVKNGPTAQEQSQLQKQASPIYTGTPFPSFLHSSRGQRRGWYTPRPLLNPHRRGEGLHSSISPLSHREEEAEDDECVVMPYVNVGHDFQAELPPCVVDWEGSPVEESPRQQLLWKPFDTLEESGDFHDEVERLLSMCSSSCIPGGGSNTELTLHCLHYCQGNTMATLEMLLFSQPLPTGDYHYSGSDLWTDGEKSLFSAALATYGKDLSLIQKMVRTKTMCQCVEFYYLSKRLQDKQNKQKEEEQRDAAMEQQKSITPICQRVDRQFGPEEAVPVPSLASFFPCKLCGKMFYKIKSRNAHMKIHRQPQEDWTDRRLQHQLLTQRLALSRPANLMLPARAAALTFPSAGLAGTSGNRTAANGVLNSVTNGNNITPSNAGALDPGGVVTYSNIAASNSHVVANMEDGASNQREPATVLPFHQSWGSFGHGSNPTVFYCSTEGKDSVGAGTVGVKEPINWH